MVLGGGQRHADAADVLEAGLALAGAVLDAEGLPRLDQEVADVAVVDGGGELTDVAVVDDRGRGVVHGFLLEHTSLMGGNYGNRSPASKTRNGRVRRKYRCPFKRSGGRVNPRPRGLAAGVA